MKLEYKFKMGGVDYKSTAEVDPTAVIIYNKNNIEDIHIYFDEDSLTAYQKAILGINDLYELKGFNEDLKRFVDDRLAAFKDKSFAKDIDFKYSFINMLSKEEINEYLVNEGFKIKIKKTGFKVKLIEE